MKAALMYATSWVASQECNDAREALAIPYFGSGIDGGRILSPWRLAAA
jgi:hypothetical protein